MNKKLLYINILLLFITLFFMTSCDFFAKEKTPEIKEEYSISNDYFDYIEFKPKVLVESNLQTNTSKETPLIAIFGVCEYELFEVEITANLFEESGKLLGTYNAKEQRKIEKYKEFNISFEVLPEVQAKTFSAIVEFSGKSYNKPDFTPKSKVIVTFNYNNSKTIKYVEVRQGNTIDEPIYETESRFTNIVWCTDKELKKQFNFSNEIYSNITLYAKYLVNYEAITNEVANNILVSTVEINVKKYDTFLGITTNEKINTYYGIIFFEDGTNYYVLTTSFAVYKDPDYDKTTYSIEDHEGNIYNASRYSFSASYGLAVLYFPKTKTKLGTIKLSAINETQNKEIVTIGKKNIISFDKIEKYIDGPSLKCSKEASNVTFSIIKNSKYSSTGGVLLNLNLELIGIQYGYSSNTNAGYAIPASKINEFLNKNFWSS